MGPPHTGHAGFLANLSAIERKLAADKKARKGVSRLAGEDRALFDQATGLGERLAAPGRDILAKLARFGSFVSDKQRAFLVRLVTEATAPVVSAPVVEADRSRSGVRGMDRAQVVMQSQPIGSMRMVSPFGRRNVRRKQFLICVSHRVHDVAPSPANSVSA